MQDRDRYVYIGSSVNVGKIVVTWNTAREGRRSWKWIEDVIHPVWEGL